MLTVATYPEVLAITATASTDRAEIERVAMPALRRRDRVNVFGYANGCRTIVCSIMSSGRAVFVSQLSGRGTERETPATALAVGLAGLDAVLQYER